MLSNKHGNICLHGALVTDSEQKGIIILGPKASGKTTICYWLMGTKYSILTDETVILRKRNGNYYAMGITRNLTIREDISKENRNVLERLYFPFSREEKTVVKFPEVSRPNQWIKISKIYKPNIHPCNLFDVNKMSEMEIDRYIFEAGLLDQPNIDYTKLQRTAFEMSQFTTGYYIFGNKDIKNMKEDILNLFWEDGK